MKSLPFAVVTPWHNPDQRDKFLKAWNARSQPDFLFLQEDKEHEGRARTKNKGVRRAIDAGAEVIIVLDDDCYPEAKGMPMEAFAECHLEALKPQPVVSYLPTTDPPSRGTTYFNRTITRNIAASMGFWTGIPDWDAAGQLRHPGAEPKFRQIAVYGHYFPLCMMNIAFRADEWPWCQLINVPRFDDIWCGYLWQRKAYWKGQAFNLAGPTVLHDRQSNVFKNMAHEAAQLERNERLWELIAEGPLLQHDEMLAKCELSV